MNKYLDSLANQNNNDVLKTFISFYNANKELNKIKTYKLEHSLSKYLNFELLNIDNKQNFVLWYVLYYNKLSENKKDFTTIKAILETL